MRDVVPGDDMDPLTAAGSVAAVGKAADSAASESAKAASTLLVRLLGPVADEMGATLAEKYRLANVRRVAERAASKVTLDQPGSIPPRVAAAVFDSAQWSEEEFVTEYLSGVLASARTLQGRDDRALAWTALIARLPTSAIKLHYGLYRSFHSLVAGAAVRSLNQLTDRSFFVTGQDLIDLLGDETEGSLMQEAALLLSAEGLVTVGGWGAVEHLQKQHPDRIFPEAGLIFRATPRGMSLMLHAFGFSTLDPEHIARDDLDFSVGESGLDSTKLIPGEWVDSLPRQDAGWTVV